jgi:K+-sensing histidine kinase KdpD
VTVAAAVKITAPDQDALIATAASYAQLQGEVCLVISIVQSLPYGLTNDDQGPVIERNLDLITSRNASPIIQQGDDVALCLRKIAEKFDVRTLFIRNGRRRFGRSIAERLIHLKPSFEVVVVNPGD